MKILKGKCSWFGGHNDKTGVADTETLALYPLIRARWLDLPIFKPYYCAMRWDYHKIMANLRLATVDEAKDKLKTAQIGVRFGKQLIIAIPVDWGPNIKTGRIIDLSRRALIDLGAKTDDIVEVAMDDWVEVT